MAKEVHRSHFSDIQWNILANVFVAVDTITLYIITDYYLPMSNIYTVSMLQEAKEEVKDIMRAASSQHPDTVRPGHAFYGGEFAKPGGHLVHRAVAGLA